MIAEELHIMRVQDDAERKAVSRGLTFKYQHKCNLLMIVDDYSGWKHFS